MTQPRLLCVIVNYCTPDLTLQAARHAVASLPAPHDEVLIVDNASPDGSLAALHDATQGLDRVRVVSAGRNGGFGAGVNYGVQTGMSDGGRTDYVYLLNSDAWTDAETITTLVEFMETRPQIGITGSFVQGEDGEPHRTAFRFPCAGGELEMGARIGPISRVLKGSITALPIPDRPTRVDWTAGASMLIRQTVLDQTGGFDEGFFLYYEETDLCHRALKQGWETWYLPDSTVTHIGSVSTGMNQWGRVPSYWLDSRKRYFMKTHGPVYTGLATAARAVGCTAYELRRLVQDKPQADPDRFIHDLLRHMLNQTTSRPSPRLTPSSEGMS
jgi:GT2 family glycosyltransferase